MKNNVKIRFFVGHDNGNGDFDNATPDRTFATFNEAKNKLDEFQTIDRQQPYFSKDLSKLYVIERTIETSFLKKHYENK